MGEGWQMGERRQQMGGQPNWGIAVVRGAQKTPEEPRIRVSIAKTGGIRDPVLGNFALRGVGLGGKIHALTKPEEMRCQSSNH